MTEHTAAGRAAPLPDTPSAEEERAILERIRGGDTAAFRTLVLNHQDRVYRLIFKQVGDSPTANDLSQEVFLRAFRSLPHFRGEATFSTWIIRIALNVTNSYFASRSYRERILHQPLTTANHVASEGENSAEEEVRQLQEALSILKPKLREVIVLSSLEGRSYDEVATLLDIPVGTVRSRLNTARNELRKLLFVRAR
jgi:RNA polymerase sigma-70 factor (ECF subfamily)